MNRGSRFQKKKKIFIDTPVLRQHPAVFFPLQPRSSSALFLDLPPPPGRSSLLFVSFPGHSTLSHRCTASSPVVVSLARTLAPYTPLFFNPRRCNRVPLAPNSRSFSLSRARRDPLVCVFLMMNGRRRPRPPSRSLRRALQQGTRARSTGTECRTLLVLRRVCTANGARRGEEGRRVKALQSRTTRVNRRCKKRPLWRGCWREARRC